MYRDYASAYLGPICVVCGARIKDHEYHVYESNGFRHTRNCYNTGRIVA